MEEKRWLDFKEAADSKVNPLSWRLPTERQIGRDSEGEMVRNEGSGAGGH